MNKIASLLLLFMCATFPTVAFAGTPIPAAGHIECRFGTKEETLKEYPKNKPAPESMVKTLIEKKGSIPSIDNSRDFDTVLITDPLGELEALLFFQDGCFKQIFGPSTKENFDTFFGITKG